MDFGIRNYSTFKRDRGRSFMSLFVNSTTPVLDLLVNDWN